MPGIDPLYDVTPLARHNASDRGGPNAIATAMAVPLEEIFSDDHNGHMICAAYNAKGCKVFSNGDVVALDDYGELMLLSKKRTSPDIYSEKQMKGHEWDDPKQTKINKLKHMFTRVSADDQRVNHLKPVDTMWTGRDKRDADRCLIEKKGRCVLRGDRHKDTYNVNVNENQATVAESGRKVETEVDPQREIIAF